MKNKSGIKNKNEKYKFIVIITLTFFCCFLAYFFHKILKISILFTHLFYIPIVLSSIWWKKKGVFISAFLGLFIVVSHFLFIPNISIAQDIFRVFIFIIIAIIINILNEYIEKKNLIIRDLCVELDQIFNISANGKLIIDNDFNIIKYNDTFLALSGLTKGEVLNKKCYQVFNHSECNTPSCALKSIIGGEEYTEFLIEKKRANGEKIICIIDSKPFLGPEGEIRGIIEEFKDITRYEAQKIKTEEILRESQQKYHVFFEKAKDAIFLSDEAEKFIDINEKGCELLGYSKEELLKMTMKDIFADLRGYEVFLEMLDKLVEKKLFEIKLKRKDGVHFVMEIAANRFVSGGQRVFLAIARDITERKKFEAEIRRSNKRFCDITENALEWAWEVDANGKYTYVSGVVEKILGYTPQEMLNKYFYELFHPDEREEQRKTAFEQFHKKKLIREFVNRNMHKNGSVVWLSTSGVPMIDENGNLRGYRGLDADITKRKKAEKKLKQSEERFRTLFETAAEGVLVADFGTKKFKHANLAICKMLGYSRKEMLELGISDIHSKNDLAYILSDYEAQSRDEKKIKEFIPCIRKDQSVIYTNANTITTLIDGKKCYVGFFTDIGEYVKAKKDLEVAYQKLQETKEELIQTSKMAAMGQLSAGISHELNQPLTGIKGFSQAALIDIKDNSPLRKDLEKIIEQADRMDKIIQNVRSFSRKSKFIMQAIDINKPIQDSLMLVNEQLKVRNIKLNVSLGAELPKIEGDANQLQQVFLNLLTNARDAIDTLVDSKGGELIVRTSVSRDKKNVEMIFKDTGCGISKENMGHIFNPFFTTKSPNGGMGLGLSISYRIIERHKGKIEGESEEGKGTRFKISFPVLSQSQLKFYSQGSLNSES